MGLDKIPVHVEEDPNGVEWWLKVAEADATASVAQPMEREEVRALTWCGTGEEVGRHGVAGGIAPHLVINLIDPGACDVQKSSVLCRASSLDALGVSKGSVDAASLASSESVLDEINCVDVFGKESEDPGSDSETYPGTEVLPRSAQGKSWRLPQLS